MEWRGSLAERAAQCSACLLVLETSGTSGSSKSGGEVGKGLVSLVGIKATNFQRVGRYLREQKAPSCSRDCQCHGVR